MGTLVETIRRTHKKTEPYTKTRFHIRFANIVGQNICGMDKCVTNTP